MSQSSAKHLALPYAISAALAFAAMSACVHALSPNMSGMLAVFVRSLIGFIIAVMLHKTLHIPFKINNKPILVVRVISGSIALIAFFEALRLTDLATATLLLYTSPIWTTILARITLHEKVSIPQLLGLPLGLIGVSLILLPKLQADGLSYNSGTMLAFIAALFAAIAYVSLRKLGSSEHPLSIVTAFAASSLLISTPIALLNFHTPSYLDLLALLGAGLFGTLGQFLLTIAYKHGQAARVAIASLVQIPFAVIISLLIFHSIPPPLSLLGGAFVFSAAILQTLKARKPKKTSDPTNKPDQDPNLNPKGPRTLQNPSS